MRKIDEQKTAVELKYANVYEWVEGYLAPNIQRKINTQMGSGLAWDPEYWKYPEVVARLTVLWNAWQAAEVSTDLSAKAAWWVRYCDPILDRILDATNGPFHNYDSLSTSSGVLSTLPVVPAPQIMKDLASGK